MLCRKISKNAQDRATGKSRKRDCVDIGHPRSGYVPLSHRRGGRRYRRERGEGLRKRGHEILKAGGEEREKE